LLDKNALLADFKLAQQNTQIPFASLQQEVVAIDIEESRAHQFTPVYRNLEARQQAYFKQVFQAAPTEKKIEKLVERMQGVLREKTIDASDLRKFLHRIFENLNADELNDIAERDFHYKYVLKNYIDRLKNEFAEREFKKWLDLDKISTKESFVFPETKASPDLQPTAIPKALYVEEGKMNGFESDVIHQVSALENIAYWTRNPERSGFYINGFINHYPDFVLWTKSGKTLVLETKGDDRDNSDSEAKAQLGNIWQNQSGRNYKYFMVFNHQQMQGAMPLQVALETIAQL
jgi:type III restriction enzyme